MSEYLKLDPARYAAIGLVALAVVFMFWPAPNRAAPIMTIAAQQPDHLQPVAAENAIGLFDLTSLPAVKPPPPPSVEEPVIDPAAAIKRYTLLGVTVNELGAIALLSADGVQHSLREGDSLAGFEVIKILPRQIDFQKDDVTTSLVLPTSDIQAPN